MLLMSTQNGSETSVMRSIWKSMARN